MLTLAPARRRRTYPCCEAQHQDLPELPEVRDGAVTGHNSSQATYQLYVASLRAGVFELLRRARANGITIAPWEPWAGMYVVVGYGDDPGQPNYTTGGAGFTAVCAVESVTSYGRGGCVMDDFSSQPALVDEDGHSSVRLGIDTTRRLGRSFGPLGLWHERHNGKAKVLLRGSWAPGALTPDAIRAVHRLLGDSGAPTLEELAVLGHAATHATA